MMKRTMKGSLNLSAFAIGLGTAAIIIAMVAYVLSGIQGQLTVNTTAYNVSGQGASAMSQLGTWLVIIAIVGAASIIIGLIGQGFGGGNQA